MKIKDIRAQRFWLSNRSNYWIVALVTSIGWGLRLATSQYFRLGNVDTTVFREFFFGTFFTLGVWWYNIVGFQALRKYFFPMLWGWKKETARVGSTLILAYLFIVLDNRFRFLNLDADLTDYQMPGYANEFRAVVGAFIVLMIIYALDILHLNYQTRLENEQLKHENAKTQFEILKQQIKPHFLFNSLNILKTMVAQRGDKASEQFVLHFSEFYRAILASSNKNAITLADEMEILEHYIYMVKMRFDEKLIIETKISDEAAALLLPPFSIQVLVENCIKHNIVSESKPLKVEIFTEIGHLVVRNNFQPKRQVEPSSGVGLNNIGQRFFSLTNRNIDIEKTERFFTVRLPLGEWGD